MIDTDTLIQAFKRGVQDGLIEQGMVHAEEYIPYSAISDAPFATDIADDLGRSEYLWKYYHDGYEFGEYLHHVMSVGYVEVMRE